MHGSPCQDFSLAGKQAGGDKGSGTRSSLMYETIRIVEKLEPKYVIWENVKNVLSKKHKHNFENYLSAMEHLGYTNYYQVLNAKDYGIPQNRERVFVVSIRSEGIINFHFPPKRELKLKLKDMLEDEVDEKYYLSDKMIEYILTEYNKNEEYIEILKKTHTPEETFYQIMAMRSPIANLVEVNPVDMISQNCKTYAYFSSDTKPFKGHPYEFTIEDFELLKEKAKECYFARKFDIDVSEEILDKIDKYLIGGSENVTF